jgi:uncharacterized protein YjbJ (UPF0337 family)
MPLAFAVFGYGLIGFLVIIALVVLIVRMVRWWSQACRGENAGLAGSSYRESPLGRSPIRKSGGLMANKNIDKAKGRAKEAAGAVSGNKRLKNEGRADQAKGSAKNAVDKVADTLTGSKKH